MLDILLVRHAESRANTGEVIPPLHGDHHIALTERGHEQAMALAEFIPCEFLETALTYCSPFQRMRIFIDTMHRDAKHEGTN